MNANSSGASGDAEGAAAVDAWERAYVRFQTNEEETRKFVRRLRQAGAEDWPDDSRCLELFCGRANGVQALRRLGFGRVHGIDLSPALLSRSEVKAPLCVGDCRSLPFRDATHDIAVVQGGLHHLEKLPEDLDLTLNETWRVLKSNGVLFVVEPWMTPFLRLAHAACSIRLLRRMWHRLDALGTMIEHERKTYDAWLAEPETIRLLLQKYFEPLRLTVGAGKLSMVGRRRERPGG